MGIVCFPFPGDWNHFSPPRPTDPLLERKAKIEALIKYVSGLSDTKFVRNGGTDDAKTAATFLRRKWKANDSEVKTARDFIDKIATLSGTSGKPYIIRFKDGSEMASRDVLLAALNKDWNLIAKQIGVRFGSDRRR